MDLLVVVVVFYGILKLCGFVGNFGALKGFPLTSSSVVFGGGGGGEK